MPFGNFDSAECAERLVDLSFFTVHVGLPVGVVVACDDHEALAACVDLEHLRVHLGAFDQLGRTLDGAFRRNAPLAVEFRLLGEDDLFAVEEFSGFVGKGGSVRFRRSDGTVRGRAVRGHGRGGSVSGSFCWLLRFSLGLADGCLSLQSLDGVFVAHRDGFTVEVGFAHRRCNRHVRSALARVEDYSSDVHEVEERVRGCGIVDVHQVVGVALPATESAVAREFVVVEAVGVTHVVLREYVAA